MLGFVWRCSLGRAMGSPKTFSPALLVAATEMQTAICAIGDYMIKHDLEGAMVSSSTVRSRKVPSKTGQGFAWTTRRPRVTSVFIWRSGQPARRIHPA